MNQQYPADYFAEAPHCPPIEWPQGIDPNTLFNSETTIKQIHEVLPSDARVITGRPVARGMNWAQSIDHGGDGEHALLAVVNAGGVNYGLVDTTVDGRVVTYVTCMANNNADPSNLIGIIDTPVEGEARFSVVDYLSESSGGYTQAAFTVTRTADGQLRIGNDSLATLRVGSGEEIAPQSVREGRFSLRSVLSGLRRFVSGPQPPKEHEAFVGRTNWMVEHVDESRRSIADYALWMRQKNHGWYVTQLVSAHER